jgi:hypothetical protein
MALVLRHGFKTPPTMGELRALCGPMYLSSGLLEVLSGSSDAIL